MAVYTFTQGEKLTANLANTYMANGGLVYVTSVNVGTAVSTVTVSNCFSATYDNYKITYFGGTASTQQELFLRIGNATTAYYNSAVYAAYSNSPTALAAGSANSGSFGLAGAGDPDGNALHLDVCNPYLARRTVISGPFVGMDTDRAVGFTGGFLANTNSYTDFTILTSTGTITGGTITVYGYRKA